MPKVTGRQQSTGSLDPHPSCCPSTQMSVWEEHREAGGNKTPALPQNCTPFRPSFPSEAAVPLKASKDPPPLHRSPRPLPEAQASDVVRST